MGVQLALTTDTGCVLSANLLQPLPPLDEAASQRAARALCDQVSALLASGASVDEHTADQLIVYMALAEGTNPSPYPTPNPIPNSNPNLNPDPDPDPDPHPHPP